jgi:hypothetical protein
MTDNYAPYSIELIITALCANKIRRVAYSEPSADVKSNDLSRALLPYLLEEVEPGWLLPLNRDYKPIGLLDSRISSSRLYPWAEYSDEKYRSLLLPTDLVDLTLLKNVWPKVWYFYNDGDTPFSMATAADRRKYHLKLWHVFRHWGIPLPKFSAGLLQSAKEIGIEDALLDRNMGEVI